MAAFTVDNAINTALFETRKFIYHHGLEEGSSITIDIYNAGDDDIAESSMHIRLTAYNDEYYKKMFIDFSLYPLFAVDTESNKIISTPVVSQFSWHLEAEKADTEDDTKFIESGLVSTDDDYNDDDTGIEDKFKHLVSDAHRVLLAYANNDYNAAASFADGKQ